MFVEPMGQTPHTDVASLTVEVANPLANHRLECTLDAIRGFAFGVERRRGDLSCLTVGAENLLHGTLAEPERLRHPPHGVLRGDRWPLSTFLIEIFLQLHDKLTFPHINSLTLRHRGVSWRASIRHSCETTISGYTTCLFGAKSCETRYKSAVYRERRKEQVALPEQSTVAQVQDALDKLNALLQETGHSAEKYAPSEAQSIAKDATDK